MEINPAEKHRGRCECESDIENGMLQFFYQTRGKWGEYMTETMQKRFNIAVVHTSCFTTVDLRSYRLGYNERMTEYIDEKHGPKTMEKTMDEIHTYRKKIYDEYVKKHKLDAKRESAG